MLSVFLLRAAPRGSAEETTAKLVLYAIGSVCFLFACATLSKRLHDFDFNGWWSVPILLLGGLAEWFLESSWPGFLLVVALACVPGSKAANQFGEVPGAPLS
jgi:uncharacterized membrane protein YhaH (DUF805 family)